MVLFFLYHKREFRHAVDIVVVGDFDRIRAYFGRHVSQFVTPGVAIHDVVCGDLPADARFVDIGNIKSRDRIAGVGKDSVAVSRSRSRVEHYSDGTHARRICYYALCNIQLSGNGTHHIIIVLVALAVGKVRR